MEQWSDEERPHFGIHRSCSPDRIAKHAKGRHPMIQFRTTSNEKNRKIISKNKPGNNFSKTPLALKCKSKDNKLPLPKKFSWNIVKKNVTCHDWKFRYCCKEMWGEAKSLETKFSKEVILVDRPERKDLFEGCTWKQWISRPKLDDGD